MPALCNTVLTPTAITRRGHSWICVKPCLPTATVQEPTSNKFPPSVKPISSAVTQEEASTLCRC